MSQVGIFHVKFSWCCFNFQFRPPRHHYSVYFLSFLQTVTWQKQINQIKLNNLKERRNVLKDHVPGVKKILGGVQRNRRLSLFSSFNCNVLPSPPT